MSERVLKAGEERRSVEARLEGTKLSFRAGEAEPRSVEVESLRDGSWLLRDGDSVRHVHVAKLGGTWWVHDGERTHVLEEVLERGGGAAEGSLTAPMTGTVQEVLVSVGDEVEKGQALLVLSAMKMQVEIKSPIAGRVSALPHAVGDQVDGGVAVAVVEPLGESE